MIRLLFMDIDGTLTDGKLYIGNQGEMQKAFHVKDGYGIHDILPRYNIEPVIITARVSEIASNRATELGVSELYQGCHDKRVKMEEVALSYGIKIDTSGILRQVAYIGDDIADLSCMKIAELSGCPMDATEEVKGVSKFISQFNGGCGAVREFIEWIVKQTTIK